MTNVLKKLTIWLGKAVLGLLVLFAAFVAYGLFAERSASGKATAMCASIAPGSDASGLRDRAIDDGAIARYVRWVKIDGMDHLNITYLGFPPFSRYSCNVTASNGQVVSTALSHLD